MRRGIAFLEFSIPDDIEEKPITLNVISNSGKPFSFQEKQGIDYGMILKVEKIAASRITYFSYVLELELGEHQEPLGFYHKTGKLFTRSLALRNLV